MPQYTYECESCGKIGNVFAAMADAPPLGHRPHACPACGKDCYRRVYAPAQLIDDTLPKPIKGYAIRPVEGDSRKVPVFESRSQIERLIKRHNEVYGTQLEHAR